MAAGWRMQNSWALFGRTAPPPDATAFIRSAADIERGIKLARQEWFLAGLRVADDHISQVGKMVR